MITKSHHNVVVDPYQVLGSIPRQGSAQRPLQALAPTLRRSTELEEFFCKPKFRVLHTIQSSLQWARATLLLVCSPTQRELQVLLKRVRSPKSELILVNSVNCVNHKNSPKVWRGEVVWVVGLLRRASAVATGFGVCCSALPHPAAVQHARVLVIPLERASETMCERESYAEGAQQR